MAEPPIVQDVLIRFRSDSKNLDKGAKKAQKAMKQTAGATRQLNQQQLQTVEQFQILGQLGGAMPGQLSPVAGAVSALSGAFKAAKGNLFAFGLVAGGVLLGVVKFADEIGGLIGKVFEVNKSFGIYRDELKLVRQEQAQAVDSSKALFDALFPEGAAERLNERRKATLKFGEESAIALLKTQQLLQVAALDPTIAGFEAERDRLEKRFAQRKAEIERVTQAAIERADLIFGFTPDASFEDHLSRLRAGAKGEGESGGGSGGGGGPVDFSGAEKRGRFARPALDPVSGGRERFRFGGPIQRRGLFEDGDERGVAISEEEHRKIIDDQQKIHDAFIQSEAAATRFGQAVTTASDELVNAFEKWGSGAEGLGTALRNALGNTIADILMAESMKQAAIGTAELIILNPKGGLHLLAAAGLAAASGAVRSFMGADGGGASAGGGGGRLPGAAAGGFGGGGGVDREQIFIVEIPFGDSPRKRRKDINDALERTRNQQGGGSTVTRQ